jgi:hypothetical protein
MGPLDRNIHSSPVTNIEQYLEYLSLKLTVVLA